MKRYDREYFDNWYRRIGSPVPGARELARTVRMVLGVAEYVLARPARSVLDIGCGEGRWRAALRRVRPRIGYTGVESSEYVLRRFGRSRNILRGTFGALGHLGLRRPFDVVVCSDVLHYCSAREIDRGLDAVGGLLRGIAFLDVSAAEDEPVGDLEGWHRRSADWYRRRFARAGLIECGTQCWAAPEMLERLGAMEGR